MTHSSAAGWRSPQTLALPVEGHLFWICTAMPLRSQKGRQPSAFAENPSDEAARLRKLAANVTTARLRSRLLEEAANQEWLARQTKDAGPSHAQAR